MCIVVLLVGNSGTHLKNLSFTVSNDCIQLVPFYDLLSVATYDPPAFDKNIWPKKTELAWSICRPRQTLIDIV